MHTIHFTDGYNTAKKGGWRAAPSNLKIATQPWRDWYAGFDAGVQDDKHAGLTPTFNARRGVKVTGRAVK